MEVIQTGTGETYYLAQSTEDVETFLKTPPDHDAVGTDTETTGLNHLKDKMVGWSIAVQEKSAIYIPVAHKLGINVNLRETVDLFKQYTEKHGVFPVFYNGKFDVSFFTESIGWKPPYYEDVMATVYLDNPDREEKGLKSVAKDDLGILMERFEDLFTPEEVKAKVFDISTKSPRRCTTYAASDADVTLRLHNKYRHIKTEFSLPFKVDTELMEIIRRMELTGGLELNLEYITKCLKDLRDRELVLAQMIYRAAGMEFAIASPKQLGIVLFDQLQLPSPGLTKSGQHATGAKELEKLAEEYPIAEWVVSYKKIQKAQGSYFEKLIYLHQQNILPRFSFNQYAAPTYRLAAPGGSPDSDGKTGVNIQAVSNGEARTLMGVEIKVPKVGESNTIYSSALEEDDLLFGDIKTKTQPVIPIIAPGSSFGDRPWVWGEEKGARICILDSCKECDVGCADIGIDVTRRQTKNVLVIPSVRQAFRAPKGYLLMGCDYDRQELVIGANLSKEPKWITALLNQEDLHAKTAMAAFSISPEKWEAMAKDEKKRKRDIGKILNFATFYGATAHTLSRNTGIPLQDAQRIYDGFVKGHPQLFNWMDKVKLFARRNGYTSTYFGRRRWLKQFYDEGSPRMKAFGDRSAVNTAVQGTGADVTRIAMVKCVRWLDTNQIPWEDVKMVMSIHDELVFLMKENMLEQVGPHLVKAMMFNVKGWDVQLSVEPKVGEIWGNTKVHEFQEMAA